MVKRVNNPFVTVGRIPEEYFCDRDAETKKIIRTVTNDDNLVLMSPRRIGKSKLIQHAYGQSAIKDNYYTFYIDLLHTTCLREFTYAFGVAVFQKLSTISQKAVLSLTQMLKSLTGTFGFDAVTGLPTFTLEQGRIAQPEFTLKEIFEWLDSADTPCIVCFDEFQRINKYADNKHGEVEALLRGYIQDIGNANFIFSGSERHLLLEMFHSEAKPFYNSASQLDLLAIPENVYIDFAQRNFEKFGKHLDAEAVHPYYDLMEGTTYYMQKILHEAFIDCEKDETCSKDLLQTSYEYLMEEESENFKKILGSLTERQKDTLYAIAREGKAEKIMSAAFIKKYALESPSIVQTSVGKLINDDIVTFKAGVYSVSDVLFRQYMIANS